MANTTNENRPSSYTTNSSFAFPTLAEYYGNLTPFITLSILLSWCLFLLILAICRTTIAMLRVRVSDSLLRASILLCSLYPVVGLASIVTLLLPSSWLITHTVKHFAFVVGAIVFRGLCFKYVGSETNFLKELNGFATTVNTPPCCCCCVCLPAVVPSRAKIAFLRYLVWQMPIVQGALMLVLNVIYYKEPEYYHNVMLYYTPFVLGSIFIGLWSLNVTVRMINSLHPELGLVKKMISLQMIILLCKLQYLILDLQLDRFMLGGVYPINHQIHKKTFIHLLVMLEMVLLSLLAQSAYRVPIINEQTNLTPAAVSLI